MGKLHDRCGLVKFHVFSCNVNGIVIVAYTCMYIYIYTCVFIVCKENLTQLHFHQQ